MRNTTLLIIIITLVFSAASLFAAGELEEGQFPYNRQFQEEKITVTGEVEFENDMHPVIKSGGKEYELMVPMYISYNSGVEEGETITVEGFVVPGPPVEPVEENEVHLQLTKAIVKGEEYDLTRLAYGGPGNMYGYRAQGQYSPGNCWAGYNTPQNSRWNNWGGHMGGRPGWGGPSRGGGMGRW